VSQTFPDLLPRYERAYPGTNAPNAYTTALEARVDRVRGRYSFDEDSMRKRRLVPGSAERVDALRNRRGRQLLLPLST
jgi:hypothetical protein